MTGQLSQSIQILTSSRGSINAMPATITSESSTSPVEFIMATVCKICAGPIEPPDQRCHCVACLGLAQPEVALDESDCGHCGALFSGPAAIWPIRGEAYCRQRALVVSSSPGGGSIVLPLRQTQWSPHSTVSFPEDCFRPPANIEEFVSFGQEEGDDSMSISASEREDWAGSEPDQTDSLGPQTSKRSSKSFFLCKLNY